MDAGTRRPRASAPQQVVVVLDEAVGLVADIFQQPQGIGIPREPQRLAPARQKASRRESGPRGQTDDSGRAMQVAMRAPVAGEYT